MATAPGAPTGAAATAGNAQAVVTFIAPASNGGATITGYTATSTPSSVTASITGASAAPITVTGLTNGTAYTFTVHATNSVGNSSESTASNSVTPATVPNAPTIGAATATNQRASVTFSAPASNGGAPVATYTVTATDTTSSPRGGQTATGTVSPITVTGLTNGDNYTFTAHATNSIGNSVESSATSAVSPHTTVPDAPINVTGSSGIGQVAVSFSPPANNGGVGITQYTVTATDTIIPANGGQVVSGATSPITIPGLTAGDAYTFTVTATNSLGTSAASTASAVVVPQSPSGANVAPPPFANATSYTISKSINQTQFTDELSTAAGQTVLVAVQVSTNSPQQPGGVIFTFTVSDPGLVWVSPASISAIVVEAVITAHVANPSYGQPQSVQDYNAVLLQVQTNYSQTLTSDQIQTAVKGLLLNVSTLLATNNGLPEMT